MTRTLCLLVAVLALLAAGCGGKKEDGGASAGTQKEQYVKEFDQTGLTLERTLTGIGRDIGSGTSSEEVVSKLEESATALGDAAKRFSKIDPPEDARSAHKKIVKGLRELGNVFERGAEAARDEDFEKLASTLQGVDRSSGAVRIKQAQLELRDKGYAVRDT
jgi:hypothetical protein